ncbi:MAG: Bifunctional oligoribonuclease and PAP phosphatase NrnA [Candidatus Hydrogenedentes bacterium ADurb.Bin101]|jgi:phosphoesterase RecJ-like protein|nr:MAG: Bifunctional oligoribonuclease and PAP phosphatase NrnA [Candidatus Hydrogenedentes bacterium ADurb.Bin101]HOC68332.1 30S ribosome-binding factor RbfA [Candidatus Hydrogenedentota bacterium]
MKAKGRTLRVGALIKEEIAKLITKGLKDPRIGFVSIMDVRMSSDLRYANVYVSLFGSEAERKSSLVGLQHSAGWIRHEVGRYLHMRTLPEIRFFPDDTLDKVYHLEEVFEEIHAEQHQQPMLALTPTEAVDALKGAGRCFIASHENPDGDAIGSMLALRLLLQRLGVAEITCALQDEVPGMYKELPGAPAIVNGGANIPEYDLAVLVDCGRLARLGEIADLVLPGRRLLIFDHHAEPGEAGASGIVDARYAATGEVIAELFHAAQLPFTLDAAACLYAAIASDTGCFRFSNTTALSHRLAAECIEAGINVGLLNQRFFNDMRAAKFEMMRRALARVETHFDGAVALSWLNEEDLRTVNGSPEDAENLINLWQAVEGVRVAALLKAFEPGVTRVSLRSDISFDSALFLRDFGGGGHARAAGATLEMPLDQARETLLAALARQEGMTGSA